MSKSITITAYEDVTESNAVEAVYRWMSLNDKNPDEYPMTGIITFNNEIVVHRREYRKGLCFAVDRKRTQ